MKDDIFDNLLLNFFLLNNVFFSNITAMEYCYQLDCLITASQELSIKVWGPDWALRVTFKGHDGNVKAKFLHISTSTISMTIFFCCLVALFFVLRCGEFPGLLL